jgi:hypothetical protein
MAFQGIANTRICTAIGARLNPALLRIRILFESSTWRFDIALVKSWVGFV